MRTPLVLAAAVAVALAARATSWAQQTTSARAPRHGTALVDMSAIMRQSTRFNQAMEQLKKEYEARALELKQEGERGNQMTEELRKLPAGSPERKALEQQILKARADYELHGKKVTDEIRDSESKIILGLLGDMRGAIERYARTSGVRLILRNDPTPEELADPRMILQEIHKPIVYQSGSDATQSILEAMNGPGGASRTGQVPVRPGSPPPPVSRSIAR
jgi:Skp family chaperone for outer membrane proteins